MAFSQDTNFFDFFRTIEVGEHFGVFYDPGEGEVHSFQGSVRWKESNELAINYTFQSEFDFSQDVCYGVMILDMENKTILRYSLHDKYDEYFEPSANSMIEIFNQGDPAHMGWNKWPFDGDLDNGYYDRAEWWGETEVAGGRGRPI